MTGLLDRYAFGWLEQPWTYRTPQFEVFPIDDFARAVASVTDAGIASDDWIYPPIVRRADRHVAGPTVRFELPPTHYLRVDPAVDRPELSDFMIMVLGFLFGLKLNPAGMGHLHRTPRRLGYLVNFVEMGRDIERAMNHVISFFVTHERDREVRLLAEAAFHWYLTSQSYHHAFEAFTFQYSVLDNVHKVTSLLDPSYRSMGQDPQKKGHTQRPVNLSEHYDIPLPPVFQDATRTLPNAARLAEARNALVHEARWLGQPLGYVADSQSWDMLKCLEHFNSQLLLSLMGIDCEFNSICYSAQTDSLDVRN